MPTERKKKQRDLKSFVCVDIVDAGMEK